MVETVAIITAGGSGARVGGPIKKQFIELSGRPLLFWTLDPFIDHARIDRIIITLPEPEFRSFPAALLSEFPGADLEIIAGDRERQGSVRKALHACDSNTKAVLIHDAVRPFVNREEITALLDLLKDHKAVIPVTRVKDTIKKVRDDLIRQTLDRDDLYSALTPQVFEYNIIRKYHDLAHEKELSFTDDAGILEYFGEEVFCMQGNPGNFKITDNSDLEHADLIISSKLERFK